MQVTIVLPMRHASLANLDCPVARTLDIIGEWWTLLIIRGAVLGARRYDDFKTTGIADNILSTRLKKLVDQGIFVRHRYQDRPERFEYLLTEKGRALGVVVAALRGWGRDWTHGEDTTRLTHQACGHDVSVRLHCDNCGRRLTDGEVGAARDANRPEGPSAAP